MAYKTIKVLINDDGTVEFDQIGYTGKECEGSIKGLIDAIGKERSVVKKPEYYKENKVQVHQKW